MTTTFVVESHICSHMATITSTTEDGKIHINVDSTCSRIRDYAPKIPPLSLRELIKTFCENPIYVIASSNRIDPDCLVPCGIAYCAWAEAGLISKSLLARFDRQCILYVDPSKGMHTNVKD